MHLFSVISHTHGNIAGPVRYMGAAADALIRVSLLTASRDAPGSRGLCVREREGCGELSHHSAHSVQGSSAWSRRPLALSWRALAPLCLMSAAAADMTQQKK